MSSPATGDILVINAGSSSIKFALFDAQLDEKFAGAAIGIGSDASLVVAGQLSTPDLPDHAAALEAILAALAAKGIALENLAAAAHRVVHGGADLIEPVRITPDILSRIRAVSELAPLHNSHNLAAIDALARSAPGLAQFASFDTAFHATNPPEATRYAVPEDWHKANIRRFGFHGISYQALIDNWVKQTGKPLPARLLAFHLGNGASTCAILNGKSVATSMGFSPLEGLTMGTRAGSIDASAALEMAARTSPETVLKTLNRHSGLSALSGGISDMKTLTETRTPKARFAIRHFCYWAARHAGSMIAAMGGVDAIAFTGGIGENAPAVTGAILKHLGWAQVPLTATHFVPADETRQIALNAAALMNGDD
ncbi:MAG: acetate/propionate family kinase [Paracoccaceae bacterium]